MIQDYYLLLHESKYLFENEENFHDTIRTKFIVTRKLIIYKIIYLLLFFISIFFKIGIGSNSQNCISFPQLLCILYP